MTTTEQKGETARGILTAAKTALLEVGYAGLSTRAIAETAGVPLSQIHYHFGSKQGLVLAVLERENQRLLKRQERLYHEELPLWKQWEQACDYLEDDLASGYVRVLHEMMAVGWSDPEIGKAVWGQIKGWFDLLASVAERAANELGGLGPFTPSEVAALAGLPFLGAEAIILLGLTEKDLPARSALRKVGAIIRTMEEES
ncbi:MAG: TetR/AcrR family transcriptional regulator [Actinobacteria bacterium]|nr:TetR/AcrR family transcriptional regulator [Actinomycetota bacterium]MCI0543491.1 TetR/AcrR family transcriptional regulator [Actinomycetota bacterium]MCI0677777.1 TetR/AcrR family transcriptional regulator [Actinomycetota bacterium]